MIFVIDKEGYYHEVYTSKPEELLFSPDQILGKNLLDIFPAQDAELHFQNIRLALEKQQMVSYEYNLTINENKEYFESRIMPVSENKILSLIRNISVLKSQTDQIKKLSMAVEQSPVAVVIADLKAHIQFVNPEFERMTGYSFTDVYNKNVNILKSGKNDPKLYKSLWENVTSGKQWESEWINRRKDGEFYWEKITISPIFNEFNSIVNYMAIKQDISQQKRYEEEILELNSNLELKIDARTKELADTNAVLKSEIQERERFEKALRKSENKYRTVVENINEVVFQTDNDGIWIFLNQSWEEITGFSIDESIGKNFLDFVHPDDREKNMEEFMPLINREKEYCRHEIRYITKTGGYRWIEVYARLGLDDNNLVTGTYGTLRDVTVAKIAETDLINARNEAEKANMAKSEFLSRMSHELRTPMNSILGFAQLLEIGELNNQQKKGVKHIINSGKHLLDLINEVLDISKIEAGRLSISIEPIELRGLIEEMIDIINPLAAKLHIHINLNFENDDHLFVKADLQRLKQVMLNLMNNAVKYNKTAGSVLIKTQHVSESGIETPFIRITITDTGIGIAPKDIDKIFTPFERIGADKTVVEGTGLGLSVVKKLVELMGGRLGVESIPGEGSSFWIELPETSGLSSMIDLQSPRVTDIDVIEKKGTILYFEDNIPNIQLVEQILSTQRPKIRLLTLMDGTKALSNAVENKPDMILLDINLPGIQGDEILEILQKNEATRHIPVIILSADAMESHIEKMTKAGAREYLTKPLDVKSFLVTIDRFLPVK